MIRLFKTISITLLIVGMGFMLAGCSQCECQRGEEEAYAFAKRMAEELPEGFVKFTLHSNETIYHDKNLEFGSGLVASLPQKGKGWFVRVHPEGSVSVYFCDADKMQLSSNGHIKPTDFFSPMFGYERDPGSPSGAGIWLSHYDCMVGYVKTDGEWQRNLHDVDQIPEEQPELPPILSTTKADRSKIKKYIVLIDKLRATYPVN